MVFEVFDLAKPFFRLFLGFIRPSQAFAGFLRQNFVAFLDFFDHVDSLPEMRKAWYRRRPLSTCLKASWGRLFLRKQGQAQNLPSLEREVAAAPAC